MGRTEPYTGVVLGACASKANSRRLVTIKGHPAFIKSKAASIFADVVRKQTPILDPWFIDDVHLDISVWYPSRRSDLDESAFLDAIQERLYLNDRQVKSRRVKWGLDKYNPRVEFTIRLMTEEDYAS